MDTKLWQPGEMRIAAVLAVRDTSCAALCGAAVLFHTTRLNFSKFFHMRDIIAVQDGGGLEQVRALFKEYAASLDFDLCFQDFEKELIELPGEYARPTGRLLLAFQGNEPAGCIALRKLAEGVGEIKRLYVRPRFRDRGLGRELGLTIVKEAVQAGYTRVRLDTVASMTEAITLYQSLGFKTIAPYRANPIPGALFLELRIRPIGMPSSPAP